jgi:hypothetical protein
LVAVHQQDATGPAANLAPSNPAKRDSAEPLNGPHKGRRRPAVVPDPRNPLVVTFRATTGFRSMGRWCRPRCARQTFASSRCTVHPRMSVSPSYMHWLRVWILFPSAGLLVAWTAMILLILIGGWLQISETSWVGDWGILGLGCLVAGFTAYAMSRRAGASRISAAAAGLLSVAALLLAVAAFVWAWERSMAGGFGST